MKFMKSMLLGVLCAEEACPDLRAGKCEKEVELRFRTDLPTKRSAHQATKELKFIGNVMTLRSTPPYHHTLHSCLLAAAVTDHTPFSPPLPRPKMADRSTAH